MDKINSIELAYKIRKDAINMVHSAHASHIGGILSCADIVAVLYAYIANYDIKESQYPFRDRIILSKGHNGVTIYAALAECGFFPVSELNTYGMNGSKFSCHVSHKNVPGVEISTGSLGHGIGVACGMALNAKLKNLSYKVYVIIGDGECNEGSVWEAAMLAAQYKLDNFTVIIDANGMQAMGNCCDVINMEPMADKWKAFKWKVIEVEDGHNHKKLKEAFMEKTNSQPKVIIARTVKGKGVSFMENNLLWHYRDPQGDLYQQALQELEDTYNAQSFDK